MLFKNSKPFSGNIIMNFTDILSYNHNVLRLSEADNSSTLYKDQINRQELNYGFRNQYHPSDNEVEQANGIHR